MPPAPMTCDRLSWLS
ncbi:hypothetical protein HU200_039079 [Digitaria exilis]|uniref:Uncharacterized protein n=1 Tax=Digitaria exilis TaxID=1010633 RepID=A0A835BDB0_9POAL|nr:hypothetical protein HU200_039079 [Digitaria exilis]